VATNTRPFVAVRLVQEGMDYQVVRRLNTGSSLPWKFPGDWLLIIAEEGRCAVPYQRNAEHAAG
jgi:hypothetical protein